MTGRGIEALIPSELPAPAQDIRGVRPDATLMIAKGDLHRPPTHRIRLESLPGGLVVLTKLDVQVVMDRDAVLLAAMAAGLVVGR